VTTTRLTARVPTTPETRDELRAEVEARDGVDTYEGLLRRWLENGGPRRHEANA
jgi:hypothetical protein